MPIGGRGGERNVIDWVHHRRGDVPSNAVEGGQTGNGDKMYVCRCNHDGQLAPGKYAPFLNSAYCGMNGEEHQHDHCELMTFDNGVLVWKESKDGFVPHGAVEAGATAEGEPLYIAHGVVPEDPNGTHLGKMCSSHRAAYITYGGKEHKITDVEVLCFP